MVEYEKILVNLIIIERWDLQLPYFWLYLEKFPFRLHFNLTSKEKKSLGFEEHIALSTSPKPPD